MNVLTWFWSWSGKVALIVDRNRHQRSSGSHLALCHSRPHDQTDPAVRAGSFGNTELFIYKPSGACNLLLKETSDYMVKGASRASPRAAHCKAPRSLSLSLSPPACVYLYLSGPGRTLLLRQLGGKSQQDLPIKEARADAVGIRKSIRQNSAALSLFG